MDINFRRPFSVLDMYATIICMEATKFSEAGYSRLVWKEIYAGLIDFNAFF